MQYQVAERAGPYMLKHIHAVTYILYCTDTREEKRKHKTPRVTAEAITMCYLYS